MQKNMEFKAVHFKVLHLWPSLNLRLTKLLIVLSVTNPRFNKIKYYAIFGCFEFYHQLNILLGKIKKFLGYRVFVLIIRVKNVN